MEEISPNNSISGNYIGLTQNGATIYSIPNAGVGVNVYSPSNTISANVISANDGNGVNLAGLYSYYNVVTGNFIGTDPTGNAARGNYGLGVLIADGAYLNTIGGSAAAATSFPPTAISASPTSTSPRTTATRFAETR